MTGNAEKAAFLREHAAASPEYGEVFRLFIGLFEYAKAHPGGTGVRVTLDRSQRERRIAEGFPLIDPLSLVADGEQATRYLSGMLALMGELSPGGGEGLQRLATALEQERFDLVPLLAACLRRERGPVEGVAAACGVEAALVEFVAEAMLRHVLEPLARAVDPAEVEGWQEAYCPVCGSRPGMAELTGDEGRRLLCCSACSFTWRYRRLACPYCGNDDPQTLSYFTVDDGPTRVDLCRGCSRYLKTRDSRKGRGEVPLDVEDLATLHLDLVAAREGLERGK